MYFFLPENVRADPRRGAMGEPLLWLPPSERCNKKPMVPSTSPLAELPWGTMPPTSRSDVVGHMLTDMIPYEDPAEDEGDQENSEFYESSGYSMSPTVSEVVPPQRFVFGELNGNRQAICLQEPKKHHAAQPMHESAREWTQTQARRTDLQRREEAVVSRETAATEWEDELFEKRLEFGSREKLLQSLASKQEEVDKDLCYREAAASARDASLKAREEQLREQQQDVQASQAEREAELLRDWAAMDEEHARTQVTMREAQAQFEAAAELQQQAEQAQQAAKVQFAQAQRAEDDASLRTAESACLRTEVENLRASVQKQESLVHSVRATSASEKIIAKEQLAAQRRESAAADEALRKDSDERFRQLTVEELQRSAKRREELIQQHERFISQVEAEHSQRMADASKRWEAKLQGAQAEASTATAKMTEAEEAAKAARVEARAARASGTPGTSEICAQLKVQSRVLETYQQEVLRLTEAMATKEPRHSADRAEPRQGAGVSESRLQIAQKLAEKRAALSRWQDSLIARECQLAAAGSLPTHLHADANPTLSKANAGGCFPPPHVHASPGMPSPAVPTPMSSPLPRAHVDTTLTSGCNTPDLGGSGIPPPPSTWSGASFGAGIPAFPLRSSVGCLRRRPSDSGVGAVGGQQRRPSWF